MSQQRLTNWLALCALVSAIQLILSLRRSLIRDDIDPLHIIITQPNASSCDLWRNNVDKIVTTLSFDSVHHKSSLYQNVTTCVFCRNIFDLKENHVHLATWEFPGFLSFNSKPDIANTIERQVFEGFVTLPSVRRFRGKALRPVCLTEDVPDLDRVGCVMTIFRDFVHVCTMLRHFFTLTC